MLQEGEVTPSATFRRISTDPASMTILEANRIMHQGKHDAVGMRALLAISTLSDSWKQSLLKRLAKLEAAELD
ncbi:3-alpha domain-containing protein [Paenibacillus sp. 1A_MP2]|uniref:3-alpha domain-containing protein n=1 Tax=Paenibacillus sp. 1A_MP2 TaxID=3457495 RepID=UPI003FCEAD80